ncbi:cell division protein FtsQ [Pustulibacterium marinum]|uniref:Cell division protein FtsQ n=1 Tax=Pustulibacterium marinum TaxID=1224947 RepID=A0A1I7GLR5_9FLAO|nr:cell division protein FtsQ/DivIB [Pustulibacterium marinum]SFU49359.1 cell division protein FtsQ [Pustulibacterium marinum]
MKKLKPYIQIVVALVLFFSLFAFSDGRNQRRNLKDVEVTFAGDQNLFITEEAVNKLLVQSHENVTNVTKEGLDLNKLERILSNNQMVKKADVYVSVSGELKAIVQQRKPLARVVGKSSFYIDDEGELMPLSQYHSARVPLVEGKITADNQKSVFKIVREIAQDDFLKENIVGVKIAPKGYFLRMRSDDFEVMLGDETNLKYKIKKLKAFYQKALKDKSLDQYSWVNLKYGNQVVCTKK